MTLLIRQALSLWLANGPGAAPVPVSLNKSDELKLGRIPGETLIKVPDAPHCLVPLTFCHSSAWWLVCASFPPGAQSPESQLEPVNWTNLNCHCMFVAGCLQGTGSLSGNLGQGKPTQRCRLGKKRMTRATTWWHHGFTNPFCHLIFEVGITNCDWDTPAPPLRVVRPNIAKWLTQLTRKALYVQAKDMWRIMTKFSVCPEQWNSTHTGVKLSGDGWCGGELPWTRLSLEQNLTLLGKWIALHDD